MNKTNQPGRPPHQEFKTKTVWKSISITEQLFIRCQEMPKWFGFKSVADFVDHAVREELKRRELDIEVQKSKREGYGDST